MLVWHAINSVLIVQALPNTNATHAPTQPPPYTINIYDQIHVHLHVLSDSLSPPPYPISASYAAYHVLLALINLPIVQMRLLHLR